MPEWGCIREADTLPAPSHTTKRAEFHIAISMTYVFIVSSRPAHQCFQWVMQYLERQTRIRVRVGIRTPDRIGSGGHVPCLCLWTQISCRFSRRDPATLAIADRSELRLSGLEAPPHSVPPVPPQRTGFGAPHLCSMLCYNISISKTFPAMLRYRRAPITTGSIIAGWDNVAKLFGSRRLTARRLGRPQS